MEINITEFLKNNLVLLLFAGIVVGAIVWRKIKLKKVKPKPEYPWKDSFSNESENVKEPEIEEMYDTKNIPQQIKELEDKKRKICEEALKFRAENEKIREEIKKKFYYKDMVLRMKAEETEHRINFLKKFKNG